MRRDLLPLPHKRWFNVAMKHLAAILLPMLLFTSASRAEEFHVVGTPLPPLMYLKNGTPSGFYVDLLHMMLKEMKDVTVSIEFYPAARMFSILDTQKNTFSLGIARNNVRENLYKWVGPIYKRIFALYKRKDRTDLAVTSFADLKRHIIGVGIGYAVKNDLLAAGVPESNIEEAVSDANNVMKLLAGRIDFVIMNDAMIAYHLSEQGASLMDVERVMIVNDEYSFYFAFNKSIPDSTVSRFQQALDTVKNDGRHEALVNRYLR